MKNTLYLTILASILFCTVEKGTSANSEAVNASFGEDSFCVQGFRCLYHSGTEMLLHTYGIIQLGITIISYFFLQ